MTPIPCCPYCRAGERLLGWGHPESARPCVRLLPPRIPVVDLTTDPWLPGHEAADAGRMERTFWAAVTLSHLRRDARMGRGDDAAQPIAALLRRLFAPVRP